MPLPNGPVARALRPSRDDRLTVEQLIAELQRFPGYYPTEVLEVHEDAPEGGFRTVRFSR